MVVLTTCIYIDCDGEHFYNHLELAVEKILFYTYMYELLGYIQFHRLCAHNLAYAIIQKRNSKNKIFAKSTLYNCVQHMLCCCFVFLRLVYPMLPVSLDCPILIDSSVFSNVY